MEDPTDYEIFKEIDFLLAKFPRGVPVRKLVEKFPHRILFVMGRLREYETKDVVVFAETTETTVDFTGNIVECPEDIQGLIQNRFRMGP